MNNFLILFFIISSATACRKNEPEFPSQTIQLESIEIGIYTLHLNNQEKIRPCR